MAISCNFCFLRGGITVQPHYVDCEVLLAVASGIPLWESVRDRFIFQNRNVAFIKLQPGQKRIKTYSQLASCQVGSRPSRHFAEYIHRNSYPKRHASWHPILIDTKSEVFVHLLFQCLLTSGLLSVMRRGSTTLTTFGKWIFSIQMHFSCKH